MKKRKNSGFSLIEMLVAVTISALLAVVGLVSYRSANRNARNARRQSDLAQVQSALEIYRTEEGVYFNQSSFASLITELYTKDYLNDATVEDPRNNGNYVYTYNYNESAGSYNVCRSTKAYEMCARLESDESYYCICTP